LFYQRQQAAAEPPGERFPCQVCAFVADSAAHLACHGQLFHAPCFFHLCDTQFYSPEAYNYHEFSVHRAQYAEEVITKCPYTDCDMYFVTAAAHALHLVEHAEVGPLHCVFCQAACPDSLFLMEHIRYHHPDEEDEPLTQGMFGVPTADQLSEYDRDTTALPAQLLFAQRSGLASFPEAYPPYILQCVQQEAVTLADQDKITTAYNERMNNLARLETCATCGVRDYQTREQYKDINITSCGALEVPSDKLYAYASMGPYAPMRSIWPPLPALPEDHRRAVLELLVDFNVKAASRVKRYYAHPEFVAADGSARVCRDCHGSLTVVTKKLAKDKPATKRKRRYMIVDACDYGDVRRLPASLGLLPLHHAEKCLIALTRLYGSVVKIQRNPRKRRQLKGQIISFPHDAPHAAAAELNAELRAPPPDAGHGLPPKTPMPNPALVSKLLHVQFLGPEGSFELSRANAAIACADVLVRPDVVNAWLKMKIKVDRKYENVYLAEDADTQRELAAFTDTLLADAEYITDPHQLLVDRVATDDTSHVRDGDSDNGAARPPRVVSPGGGAEADSLASSAAAPGVLTDPESPVEPASSTPVGPADMEAPVDESWEAAAMAHVFLRPAGSDALTPEAAEAQLLHEITDRYCPNVVKTRRGEDPLNEFEENDRLFLGAFPDLFLLGEGLHDITSSLPKPLVRAMLHQYTAAFAQNALFLFTAFNQRQRHTVATEVSSRARTDPAGMAGIAAVINDPTFIAAAE
jgi:hypothetical protein